MDETACNYNPTATYDDGSCVDAWRCTGCMDITACNYNINATKPGVDSVVYISSTYEFFPQGATETPGTIVYTPPGLGSEGYLIPAYCIYTEDDCQECSGDVDGSGIVMFGDTLIGGQTWCEQEVGCGDPLACDFNQDVHPDFPSEYWNCQFYPESGTCQYCSGALDGSGFIISGDEDGDKVCDVVDANRRVPLTLMAYAGSSIDGTVEIDGPYADLSWDFTIPGQHKRELNIFENFTSIQFGQEFNLEVKDAGNFSTLLSTPTAETLPLGTVSETVDIYALRPVTLTDEIIGNVLPVDDDENTVWYRTDATENSSIPSWSLDAPEMTGSFPVFDGTTFVQSNYDRSNLNQTADHQNKKMVLASYGTNTTVGGADIEYIQLPSDQTFFGDSILDWSPTHYQEFLGTNVTDDLNSLVISTSLERDETEPLFLEGANHMTGGTVSDVDLQGNTTTSKRDLPLPSRKKSFTATLNSVPYAGLSAQLSQPKKASIASQLQAPGAWLNARLDATALSGAIGGAASALYWHWGASPMPRTAFGTPSRAHIKIGKV